MSAERNFKIIEITTEELSVFGGIGVCDWCNEINENGFYIAVLNSWYCSKCYHEWIMEAVHYKEDIPIEEYNYRRVKKLLKEL